MQAAIDEILLGLKGVRADQHEVIVYSRSETEHNERLKALLRRFSERNDAIRPESCIIRVHELSYLGFIVGNTGYSADPERLTPLDSVQSPKNQEEVSSILGCLY